MSSNWRRVPGVDQITPELEALLAQFTDEEIETGVIAREGTRSGDHGRESAPDVWVR